MKNSVFATITFVFIIAFLGISSAMYFLLTILQQQVEGEINRKYSVISYAVLVQVRSLKKEEELLRQLKNYGLTPITDYKKATSIVNKAEVKGYYKYLLGESKILKVDDKYYLHIEDSRISILLEDNSYKPSNIGYVLVSVYILIIAVLILAYYMTIKKLKPLKALRKEIDRFAKGDLMVNCKTQGQDEIARVANALDKAISNIRQLNSSRKLFLRNIMHELKTPITKGMITLEMLPESKQQERLKRVFLRLENLINEFASIEKITSGIKIEENFKTIRIVDIIDEAIDIAMINQNSIEIINEDEDVTIEGDFKLFSIAIKNLIDNAIKYSHDSKAVIKFNKQRIIIANRGEKLKQSLEYYVKPFTQEESATSGFGLGLYIVVTILEAHKKELLYKHKNNTNYFTIKLTEVS
jgi:two-component system OmpR family sensor kinase